MKFIIEITDRTKGKQFKKILNEIPFLKVSEFNELENSAFMDLKQAVKELN